MADLANEIPLIMSAPSVARLLGVKPDSVRGWIVSQELEASDVGRRTRPRYKITRPALLLFLERRRVGRLAAAPTPRRPRQAVAEPKWRRY